MGKIYRGDDGGSPAIFKSDTQASPGEILIDSVHLIDNAIQIDTLQEPS